MDIYGNVIKLGVNLQKQSICQFSQLTKEEEEEEIASRIRISVINSMIIGKYCPITRKISRLPLWITIILIGAEVLVLLLK